MVWANLGVRRLAISSAASQVADWSGRLVLTILIFEKYQLAWAVGAVSSMFFLAWLGPGQRLAALAAGFGTRGVMLRTEVVRGVVFAILALPGIPLGAPTLIGVVIFASLADPLFEINRASLSVEVAGDQYGSAVKLLSAVNQVAQLAGFAIGGAFLALAGDRFSFLGIAVLFAVSAIALVRISTESIPAESSDKGSLAAARSFFASDRLSLVTMVASLLIVSAAMVVEAIAAVYGSELGLSESGIGIIAAALPLASFIGMAGIKTDIGPSKMFTVALAASGIAALVGAALFSSAGNLGLAAAGYGAIGLALVVSVAGNVVVGSRIPAADRGPVFGVIQGVLYSTMAAAAAFGGLVAEFIGAKATNTGAALALAAAAFGSLIVMRTVPAEAPRVES